MLVELRIRNFAIIDALTLPFAPGFNVLTGETGAGKSIIVEALSVLVGERASADLIRTGADRATVEGVFELGERRELRDLFDARGVEIDSGTVVLKREISGARSRAWANGTPITAAVLAEFGRALVNIHGQHEAQSLLDVGAQRRILDAFAGAQDTAAAVHAQWNALAALELASTERARQRNAARAREDWLRHVVRELGDAHLRVGEDAELDSELRLLAHAEDLRRGTSEAAALVDRDGDGVLAQLGAIRRTLASLARIDDSLSRTVDSAESVQYQLQELARDLAAYAEGVDANPDRLASVERRRALIHSLTRKYGGSEEAALSQLAAARAELTLVDDGGASGAADEREMRAARAALDEAAARLSLARRDAAVRLARDIEAMLPSLGLTDGKCAVRLLVRDHVGPDGAEDVEFVAALNVGHDARSLSRIASGGEMSRVMLAIKTVLARLDAVPTLIFDEVDAGIGGAVALRVGDALRRVAEHHQVFAITHLPQIAARAQHHIVVSKAARGGITTADTEVVADDRQIREIARMLGGDPDSSVGREHARELLAAAAAPANAPRPKAARTREAQSGRR